MKPVTQINDRWRDPQLMQYCLFVFSVERVEVPVEVPAGGGADDTSRTATPPLRISPTTLIPQVHLFNENNQKVHEVSHIACVFLYTVLGKPGIQKEGPPGREKTGNLKTN